MLSTHIALHNVPNGIWQLPSNNSIVFYNSFLNLKAVMNDCVRKNKKKTQVCQSTDIYVTDQCFKMVKIKMYHIKKMFA